MPLIALLLIACAPGPAWFVAEIDASDGPDVLFGAAVREDTKGDPTVDVYACGAGDVLDTHTFWASGAPGTTVRKGAMSVELDEVGAPISFSDGTGRALDLSVELYEDAVLYQAPAEADGCRTGLVIFDRGEARGMGCGPGGAMQVVPINDVRAGMPSLDVTVGERTETLRAVGG